MLKKSLNILFGVAVVTALGAIQACSGGSSQGGGDAGGTADGGTLQMKSSAKAITEFSFAPLSTSRVIDEGQKTIVVTVPWTTDVTSLIASFATTGTGVTIQGARQVAGATVNNFTNPVIYTVTAEDGTTVDYTVTVNVALPLSSYKVGNPAVSGVIDQTAKYIEVLLPADTDLTALVASFVASPGATVTVGNTPQVSGTTANNFKGSILYRVTAPNGTTVEYTTNVFAVDWYVDAANGQDATNCNVPQSSEGTSDHPFKTIKCALAATRNKIVIGGINTVTAVAKIKPGIYDAANGETFPLLLGVSGITLIGDIATNGRGAGAIGATEINTNGGNYTITAGGQISRVCSTAVAMNTGNNGPGSGILGFSITGSTLPYGIVVDASKASLVAHNTIKLGAAASIGVYITGGSSTSLSSNAVDATQVAVGVDDSVTSAKLRGNHLNTAANADAYGVITPLWGITNADIDLGTAADPGNNVISPNPLSTKVGFQISVYKNGPSIYNAVGNTWKAGIENADAQGHYPGSLTQNPVPGLASGYNFAMSAGISIQF